MTGFDTLMDPAEPVHVVLVGAGGMGKVWLNLLLESPDVELVGLVDLDTELARDALSAVGRSEIPVSTAASDLARVTDAQAVVNVTVPVAHHAVNVDALFAGLPVLCEKPIAPTVSQALSLAAASEVSGQLLMTSQSRRYYDALAETKRMLPSLGDIGILSSEYFMAPRFGGFRDEMDFPLLLDMAIHPFDVARYLLDADPVSVYCESFNPSWSWYSGDAACSANFEFGNGTRFIYTGSWCTPGFETSWNGSWRVSGSGGTALWDGEHRPSIDAAGTYVDSEPAHGGETIAGSLAEFIDALRTGRIPSGEVHSNVLSLAMVESAVASARSGQRVQIAPLLEDAYRLALANEANADIKARLESWGTASKGLAQN